MSKANEPKPPYVIELDDVFEETRYISLSGAVRVKLPLGDIDVYLDDADGAQTIHVRHVYDPPTRAEMVLTTGIDGSEFLIALRKIDR